VGTFAYMCIVPDFGGWVNKYTLFNLSGWMDIHSIALYIQVLTRQN